MVNELLINLVNSVLSVGKRTARGNHSYHCPKCNHHKPKLEINFDESSPNYQKYACWSCGFKGANLYNLFKEANAPQNKLDELQPYLKVKRVYKKVESTSPQIELPKEYEIFLNLSKDKIEGKRALSYLKSRGITKYDILKYNIGYCDEGQFSKHIIIPSYDKDNKLNYFTAREYYGKSYSNPPISRDTIIFESQINWNIPIILCEGVFDAITIKRTAIPLLGKSISKELLKKIVTSQVQKIYIALDKDAIKQSLKHCEYLINQGKQVYLVEMDQKDANEIGFRDITQIIQNTYPLTEYDLMDKKLNLI
jgi:DNA primase